MQCSNEDLERAMDAFRKTFSDDEPFMGFINPKYDKLKTTFNSKAITHCFGNYINAELDYKTEGVRGLGRMSTYIPRLGAYFRKPISKLAVDEINELYRLIQDTILIGYLNHALGSGENLEEAVLTDGEELFKAWIPEIYSSGIGQMEEGFRNMLTATVEAAYRELTAFFSEHGMKGGGFLAKDKTDDIFIYYALAGFILRVTEVRG